MPEPSVLDYVKSLLTPWKGKPIPIPEAGSAEIFTSSTPPTSKPRKPPDQTSMDAGQDTAPAPAIEIDHTIGAFPLKASAGLLLAFAGQWLLAPPLRLPAAGLLFLLLSVGFIAWAYIKGEWMLSPSPKFTLGANKFSFDITSFAIGIVFALLTFLTSGSNRFSFMNISLLVLSIGFLVRSFWIRNPSRENLFTRFSPALAKRDINLSISGWVFLLIVFSLVIVFFRLYHLNSVPPEMVSDHAEKYLDVREILNGNTQIFFPRNGGREALQFYLISALLFFFNSGINFLTLKISTTLVGLLALPFIYLLGVELGSRRVGFFALVFAGTAYWLNVVSRAGMRLPFYVLFTAVALYYFIKALKTSNRNDFILCGLSIGLGFYGYSANRILPLLVAAGVILFLLHKTSSGYRKQLILHTGILFLFAFVVSLPLLRYSLQDPVGYSGRMVSRLGANGDIPPLQLLQTFITNTLDALAMFSWSAGVVWVVSIPDFPALGWIGGGLFYAGITLFILRYIQKRNWLDIYILISIPALMLPSILSLAFPGENPNLYRTGGAAVPVFILTAFALDALMGAMEDSIPKPWGRRTAWGAFSLLFLISSLQNFDLVFNRYYQQYLLSAQNTSEMGTVIRGFIDTGGSPNSAWVVGYPHWADTRLVSINAGIPFKDFALFSDRIQETLKQPPPKLFIIHPEDEVSIDALPQIYGDGWFQRYQAKIQAKDFLMFFVPGNESSG